MNRLKTALLTAIGCVATVAAFALFASIGLAVLGVMAVLTLAVGLLLWWTNGTAIKPPASGR